MIEHDTIDAAHLRHQALWSEKTFGPGPRVHGVVDHMRKELKEVLDAFEADLPTGPEWIDLIILAFDGAWRSGMSPLQIIHGIKDKQGRNERRKWPDWRKVPRDRAVEHVRNPEKSSLEQLLEALDYLDGGMMTTEQIRQRIRGMILEIDGG